MNPLLPFNMFFFFNDTATTEIYTLSLHDALPIWTNFAGCDGRWDFASEISPNFWACNATRSVVRNAERSEEHTSELQSPCNLVCRLLLEKKKMQYLDILSFAHGSLQLSVNILVRT